MRIPDDVASPALTTPADVPNAIHCAGAAPGIAWTTSNAGEAIPGVVTPLTWSFFGDRTERGTRGAFADFGVLREHETARPERPEERMWDVFFGRAAVNVDVMRGFADRMPGTDGDALELQMLGSSRDHVANAPDRARYPIVAVKAPIAATRVAGRLDAQAEAIDAWWRAMVAPGAIDSPDRARRELAAAADRFLAVMRPHTVAAFLCQGLYEQVTKVAARAGRPGLETTLITGYGAMSETAYVAELWDVSRGRLHLDEFVARHGYHGPNEGELAARVWRLDRAPLERLLVSYAARPDDQAPREVERARSAERLAAEAEVLAATPRLGRPAARAVLAIAGRIIPLRGTGKAAFLQCVDVARAAALVLGRDLAGRGRLADERDVFLLTLEELVAPHPPVGLDSLVAERRAIHEEYRTLESPGFWEGTTVPVVRVEPDAGARADRVTGTPVTPGVVEGTARVVLDPEEDDGPDEGEILVCRTTDPSWASVLVLSAALVIDIGGPISHGAIVARELGVPCVIGTGDGTEVIGDGDRIRVDGSKGEVVVLERAAG